MKRRLCVRHVIIASGAAISVAHAICASAKCWTGDVAEDHRYGPLVSRTEMRAANARDAERAAHLISTVRVTLLYYRSRFAAARAGYHVDHPLREGKYEEVPRLGVPPWGAAFDPRLPAALIYGRSSPFKEPVLIGVRFAVQYGTTDDSLNRLVPLSVARWIRVSPRCTLPNAHPWTVDIFPFEQDAALIWRQPNPTTYVTPWAPGQLTPASAPGQTLPQPTPWPTAPPISLPYGL